jgi:hypothetical protein
LSVERNLCEGGPLASWKWSHLMTDTKMPIDLLSGDHARACQSSAYMLRQHAINTGGDIEGWRLARRMRDAATLHQFIAVAGELATYMQSHTLELPKVA